MTLTELQAWELAPWDSFNFNQEYAASTRIMNKVVLAEASIVTILNCVILFLGMRHEHLRANAANVLFLALSFGNAFYGAVIVYYRIFELDPQYIWEKDVCVKFAFLNVYTVCFACVHMFLICAERFAHIVLERSVPRKYALLTSLCMVPFSAGYSGIHFIESGTGIIGSSGLFCYPTRLGSWQGACDIAVMGGCIFCIAVVYGFMLRKIRRSYVRAASQNQLLQFGKSTVQGLRENGMVVASHLRSEGSAGGATSATRSSTNADRPPLHLLSGDKLVTPPKLRIHLPLFSLRSFPSASNMSPQRSIELHVLQRGVVSFLAFSFVFPFCYLVWVAVTTGQRAHPRFEQVFVATKFISELSDPIIMIALDRNYRTALHISLPQWLSRRFAPS
ncbi:hypothetical protein BC828DRAFT_380061 [Blastocladiella britannica]|nr:hypothetical protein BC828DRAFT_380061 [Blastocladiella britannica]